MTTRMPIPRLDIKALGIDVDWGPEMWAYASKNQFYIENEPFNFRRAPFSVVQLTDVDEAVRHEFLNMACAASRISWDSFANMWHPDAYVNKYRKTEHCFSRFCILYASGAQEMLHMQPATPDYRRGNWYEHDFRSVERMLDCFDEYECRPEAYLFVAEWRALVYYSAASLSKRASSDVFPSPRLDSGQSLPEVGPLDDYCQLPEVEPIYALSKVIYWPSEGLDQKRLLRCVREKLNQGKQDAELLCRAAALLGVKVDNRVAQR